jgi:hypothetical protein
VAASTLGYTLPGLIHIQTYKQEHRDMVSTVMSFVRLRYLGGSESPISASSSSTSSFHRHSFASLHDEDEEEVTTITFRERDQTSSPVGKVVSLETVWKHVYPFLLSYVLIVFGLMTLVIGMTTIISQQLM